MTEAKIVYEWRCSTGYKYRLVLRGFEGALSQRLAVEKCHLDLVGAVSWREADDDDNYRWDESTQQSMMMALFGLATASG